MPHPILSLIKETLAVLKLQVHVDTSTPKPITFSLVSFPSWRNSEEKSFHSFVWLRFSVLIVSRTTSLQGNLHKMIYSLWTEKCSDWKMQDSNENRNKAQIPQKEVQYLGYALTQSHWVLTDDRWKCIANPHRPHILNALQRNILTGCYLCVFQTLPVLQHRCNYFIKHSLTFTFTQHLQKRSLQLFLTYFHF